MAIRRIEADTGIYVEPKTKYSGSDIEIHLKKWADNIVTYDPARELPGWLCEVDQAAVKLIEDHGGEIHVAKRNGRPVRLGAAKHRRTTVRRVGMAQDRPEPVARPEDCPTR